MRAAPNFMLALLTLSISGAYAAEPEAGMRPMGPISAHGNPAYLTDSNGFVVRSSQGECWRTGSWTPALATVVGCDGVLAKAVPVPAPAPSPAPVPVAPEPPAAETPAPPAATAAEAAPVVVPPAPTSPTAAAIAPTGADAGQPASEKITLDTDAYFDFDRATLKPDGKRKLQELAQKLSSMALEVVVATGHTDWTGSDGYNQKLSERRAGAVREFLVQQGLPEKRIFTEGKGEKQPIASNRTREGRAKNRRVEVELVGTRKF